MGTKKSKARGRKPGGKPRLANPPRLIEYIQVPKHWFSDPLIHSMAALVRPPTKNTRRKQLVIKMGMPLKIFLDLVKDLDSGDCPGFKWKDDSRSALEPTDDKPSYYRFKYTLGKPRLIDKVWSLEKRDKQRRAKPRPDGTPPPFRRGKGAAKLHLSQAAASRGERTDLISMVTGNVILDFKQPKSERAMPTLQATFAASTMDKNGHINWATKYGDGTAAALRKRLVHHLTEMIAEPEYPTLEHMSPSLKNQSATVLLLK